MVELKQLEKQVITTELKKIFDKYSSSELTTEEKDALKNRKTILIQCYEYLENFKNKAASNDDMFLDSLMDFIGDILDTLLPAGSISGTPKKSTMEIIEKIEDYDREYFSGVFGVYDGLTLQSGVMIRFVQKTQDGYLYKSGGGITLDSDALEEYNELNDKVYLP